MLDRVSTLVLGLDGEGNAEVFADYSQWETWLEERKATAARNDARSDRARGSCSGGSLLVNSPARKNSRTWKRANTKRLNSRVAEAEQDIAGQA